MSDNNSLFSYYKSFIKLRNTSYALTYGTIIPVNIKNNPSLCAFVRSDKRESLLVIHNLSGKIQTLKTPSDLQDFKVIYFASKAAQTANGQVKIPPYSTVILAK
jgi:glycosidase